MRKKVNLPSKVQKGIKKPTCNHSRRYVTHQTNVGAMEKKNSLESATTVSNMVTRLMNARRNQNLKVNVKNARSKVTRHPNVDQNYSI